jgi:Flp pilus assembly pilin Flp
VGRVRVLERETMVIIGTLRGLIEGTRKRLDGESGQAMVEYALLLSLIAIVCIGIVQSMGLGLSSLYSTINARFP